MKECINGELIVSPICKKISSWFAVDSKHPKIYKEQVVQGFTKPSFFVTQINVEQQKLMNNSFRRLYQMNIRYHAQDDLPNEYQHLRDVENELLQCLSTIEVPTGVEQDGEIVQIPKPVRCTHIDSTIRDGVLQVFVNYTINVRNMVAKDPEMRRIKII